ncbi:hypothetical protein B296_00047693 [Ensete ventricosum]|uniref:Uncharacterized protein n=1 Tax=Ensete ventricosum TaxID=4639 RepID=A0A426XV82_ENSVE|nr:hypothetical protein B296_00047693 [Ensete ventricosum]
MQVGAPSENFKMLTAFRRLKQSRAMDHHRRPPDGGGGGTRKPAMFPSPHRPVPSSLGLTRYGSAPGSFLSGVADSVIGGEAAAGFTGRLFPGESPSLASESSCKSAASAAAPSSRDLDHCRGRKAAPSTVADPSSSGSKDGDGNLLLRHSSSPAGFFSHLMLDNGQRSPPPPPPPVALFAFPFHHVETEDSRNRFSRPSRLSKTNGQWRF